MPKSPPSDLVFFDLETTGLDPDLHEIIEIAAIRTSPDGLTEKARWHRLVRPEHLETATLEALQVNGYEPDRWKLEAVSLYEGLMGLANLCMPLEDRDVSLVAHHAAFDWSFARPCLSIFGLKDPLNCRIRCTQSMATPLKESWIVESTSLEALCTYFGISNQGAHRAMKDVERMRGVYLKLLEMYSTAFFRGMGLGNLLPLLEIAPGLSRSEREAR